MRPSNFETNLQLRNRTGSNYRHPLDAISIVGGLVEAWPDGSYVYLKTECPTAAEEGGYSMSLRWYISEAEPLPPGTEFDWLCTCVRAEKVAAIVMNSLLIRDEGPAVITGSRSLLWPESFKTIDYDDYREEFLH